MFQSIFPIFAFIGIFSVSSVGLVISLLFCNKYKLYYLQEENEIINFLKKNKPRYSSLLNASNKTEGNGWVITKNYIGYVYENNYDKYLYVLCNTSLLDDEDTKNTSKKIPKVKLLEKISVNYYSRYKLRNIKINNVYTPRKKQLNIVKDIINIFNTHKNTSGVSFLITGNTGSGKSTIPYIVASHLNSNVNITDEFNPIYPGNSFSNIFIQMGEGRGEVCIIILEEVDIVLNKIHNNLVNDHPKFPIMITNKTHWNNFLDKINRKGLYSNLIFIMTSNKNIEYFNSLDKSYMRNGRVNRVYTLN